LDALAHLDFPINPQICHDAAPATFVEFPAYEKRLQGAARPRHHRRAARRCASPAPMAVLTDGRSSGGFTPEGGDGRARHANAPEVSAYPTRQAVIALRLLGDGPSLKSPILWKEESLM